MRHQPASAATSAATCAGEAMRDFECWPREVGMASREGVKGGGDASSAVHLQVLLVYRRELLLPAVAKRCYLWPYHSPLLVATRASACSTLPRCLARRLQEA